RSRGRPFGGRVDRGLYKMDSGGSFPAKAGETASRRRGSSPRRALLLMNETLAALLQPALQNEGILAEAVGEPDLADVKVQLGGYDLVLFAPPQLPGLDCSHLVRWRQQGVTSHVLVLLPRDSSSADKVQTLEAGADGYLGLPVSIEELVAHIHAL